MSKAPTLLLLTFLICFPLAVIANAQTTLQLGTPVERELGSGNVHEFSVSLEEGQYIQLVVEQRGIDVIVKVLFPSGKIVGEYDTPTGGEGLEHVSFVAVAAGNYRITVGPLEPKDPNTGRYQIKILELRQATDQELKTSKNLEVTKARGLALLTEIEGIIPQIKSPQNRIKAQLQAAQLLGDVDEKRAAKFLADASTDLKELLASVDVNDISEDSPVSPLLHEVITALAANDPDAALSLLHSTSQIISSVIGEREHVAHESSIELAIADQVIRKNPKRALQIAQQSLKRAYSPNLLHTLSQLGRQNPELGAELGNEIAAKLLTEKFVKNPEAANLATSLLQVGRTPDSSESTNGGEASFLSEDKFRDLLRKVFDEAVAYSQSTRTSYDHTKDTALQMLATLQSLATQMETLVPGSTATVEKKIAELNSETVSNARQFSNAFGFSEEVVDGTELSLETIKKAPGEIREHLYIQLANTQANKGDLARARQTINDHIVNPLMRREALRGLEQQEVHRSISKGKVEEALKSLSSVRNPRERAQQLGQIASQIGPGQNRAAALGLLEQARSMLGTSPQAQDHDHMFALLEIARAFSRYDSKRAFEIIDPLIEQFNDICVAARTLQGFGAEYYGGEELDLQNGNPLAMITGQISTALGGLAVINFDRAKATTDRIKPPEVRLKVYLDIAQQTIHATK